MDPIYSINGRHFSRSSFEDRLRDAIESEVDEDTIDEYIDDAYGSIDISYSTFTASQILKNCDESMYSEFRDSYINDEVERIMDDLENENINSYDAHFLEFKIIKDDDTYDDGISYDEGTLPQAKEEK